MRKCGKQSKKKSRQIWKHEQKVEKKTSKK